MLTTCWIDADTTLTWYQTILLFNMQGNLIVPPRSFWEFGMEYAGMGRNANVTPRNEATFKSHFGTLPGVCAFVWDKIHRHCAPSEFYHLLWALLFIKTYSTESVLKGKVGVRDEETYMTHTWRVLFSISNFSLTRSMYWIWETLSFSVKFVMLTVCMSLFFSK